MMAYHVQKSDYLGLATDEYHVDFGDVSNEQKHRCFCRTISDCPKKGTLDMFPCYKIPITVSKPHFLEGDPKLLEDVIGLMPNKTEHNFHMHVEMVSV